MSNENWINQILSSANNKSDIPVSVELKDSLMRIPTEVKLLTSPVPMRAVFLIAAGVALLISLNVIAFKKSSNKEVTEQAIYTEYFSYLDQL